MAEDRREDLLERMHDTIVRNPGIKARELNRELGVGSSAMLRSKLLKRGQICRRYVGDCARFYPADDASSS